MSYRDQHTLSVENTPVGSLPDKSLPVKSLSAIVILLKKFRKSALLSQNFLQDF
jgi:hypothetical protein